MKSKKKKNKQNILIAYNKSIASMQGIELAMLFCHAGFSVKTILVDNAEEHISSELLKEVTEHAPWSNSHKPNWIKANIKYPVCIIIEPSEEFQGMVLAENNEIATPSARNEDSNNGIGTASLKPRNDGIFEKYIKEHCETIKILQKKELAEQTAVSDVKKQIIAIPENSLQLRKLFEKILSESVALTAAKALDGEITYRFEGDLSKIDYVKELEKAFAEGGVDAKNGIATPPHCSAMQPPQSRSARQLPQSSIGGASDDVAKLIISNGKKEIEVVLEADEAEKEPTENRIYISKHKNGLLLTDNIETRLLPDFSCQSCYSRFVTYLKVSLTRKNRGDDK